jgi:hypothetical protein
MGEDDQTRAERWIDREDMRSLAIRELKFDRGLCIEYVTLSNDIKCYAPVSMINEKIFDAFPLSLLNAIKNPLLALPQFRCNHESNIHTLLYGQSSTHDDSP